MTENIEDTQPTEDQASILHTISKDFYTTKEVAQAVDRKPEHWCRIRHRFIAKYELEVVKIGRRLLYRKGPVNQMIQELSREGG